MKAEQVKYSELRPTVPYYFVNPLERSTYMVFYAGLQPEPEPDDLVWTVYESWMKYNPWLKQKETEVSDNPLGNLMVGPDEHLRG